MNLKEQLTEDMKTAAKAKDKVRLSTIRMVRADIKNKEIALRHELADGEIMKLLATLVKQRKESIGQFEKGGRDDLVAKEQAELEVLAAYLPEQLDEAEVEELVKAAIAETGATSKKDMGLVMRTVMARAGGRADGKIVNRLVSSLLP
ncbi:MAG: GatB/YqeY domain-containing protein [Deltaproteobacteria bacterium]|nr:GatB/YqeY domain-containing protein [Candidatus Anaeroferrophillus wilburensis]MBN2888636.1 GatB/YqeY domain-containing protein [Deltaproteobacteria bacterium]